MTNDPIVQEIREIRKKIAEAFNHDLGAICHDIRERIARGEFEVVRLPPRPPSIVPTRAIG